MALPVHVTGLLADPPPGVKQPTSIQVRPGGGLRAAPKAHRNDSAAGLTQRTAVV